MTARRLGCALLLGLALGGGHDTWAEVNEVRFWILPFDNAAKHKDLANASRAVPELLTLFVTKAGKYSVVEREHLERILSEHSLSREGFAAHTRRTRIGRLLGATAMITGSVAREGERLLITAHVTDVESGRVQASAKSVGSEDRLAETVEALHQKLMASLSDAIPATGVTQVELRPLENLHFLRGLSYFYAARYAQALAELIQCGDDAEQDGLPAWWRAKCYLAREEYDHAYLELMRSKRYGLGSVGASEYEAKVRECQSHMTPEDVQALERLASVARAK